MSNRNLLKYRGYYGSYGISEEDEVFYGKLEFIRDLISYEGDTAAQVVKAFHEAVDDYLLTCEEIGREAEKPFSGTFNVRIGRELHGKAAMAANAADMNLNAFVKNAVSHVLSHK